MTKQFLMRVADCFTIRGRGVVLMPERDIECTMHVYDDIVLSRPDGTEYSSVIRGIEIHGNPVAPILVEGLTCEDVPIGTEVWLTGTSSAPPKPIVCHSRGNWISRLVRRFSSSLD